MEILCRFRKKQTNSNKNNNNSNNNNNGTNNSNGTNNNFLILILVQEQKRQSQNNLGRVNLIEMFPDGGKIGSGWGKTGFRRSPTSQTSIFHQLRMSTSI